MKMIVSFACAVALVLGLTLTASAEFVAVDTDTLENLAAGASLQVNDVHYVDFNIDNIIAQGGAVEPDPAFIDVTAGLFDGQPALRFDLVAVAGPGQLVDVGVTFDVHANGPITLVTGNLTGEASVAPGLVSLAEKVYDATTYPNGPALADLPLSTNQDFIQDPMDAQVAWITVVKDLALSGGAAGLGGSASISQFFQIYEVVPEPSSFALIGLALLGALGFRRR